MLERHILTLRTEDAGLEDAAATRERLKSCFPPGAVRRMTQLGMLMSNILETLSPAIDDAIIYASQYGESRTLETYLESFPTPSPIGFQTSIHPGAVQQGMIRRAQPVGEFFPMAGSGYLVGQALLSALMTRTARTILCGGEEHGTWLVPIDGAHTRAFAYGMILTKEIPANAAPIGRLTLETTDDKPHAIEPAAWFDTLHARKPFSGVLSPGWRTTLSWL